MYQIIEHCPSVIGIHNDIGVYEKTLEEHNKNLLHLIRSRRIAISSMFQSVIFNSNKSLSMDACS